MRSLFFLLIIFANPAFAQNPNIEINMNILDVLEEEELGLQELNERAVPNAAIIEPEVTFSAAQNLSTEISIPPIPSHKPAFVNLVTQAQFQAIKMEDRVTRVDGVPQKEPRIKQTPSGEDFGAAVAVNSVPVPQKRPAVMHAPSSFIELARAGLHNKPKQTHPSSHELNVIEPSAHDVLAKIEGIAGYANKKTALAKTPKNNNKNVISLGYKPGVVELPEAIQVELRARTFDKISNHRQTQIEVAAYASTENSNIVDARRISLSRALKLRDFLIENGIESEKIAIRALGDTAKTKPFDRAELRFIR